MNQRSEIGVVVDPEPETTCGSLDNLKLRVCRVDVITLGANLDVEVPMR